MRLASPRSLLFCGVLLAGLPANAASQMKAPQLLTKAQGQTVARAALAHRESVSQKPDCSHFVHQVYEFAGFPYRYANSLDLYEGVESFRRVEIPHTGDLIVWRGHVGIVTNPKQHAFFSSVRSGLRDEYWNQAYWLARGRPRFYRYVVANGRAILAADSSPTAGRHSTSRETQVFEEH